MKLLSQTPENPETLWLVSWNNPQFEYFETEAEARAFSQSKYGRECKVEAPLKPVQPPSGEPSK